MSNCDECEVYEECMKLTEDAEIKAFLNNHEMRNKAACLKSRGP